MGQEIQDSHFSNADFKTFYEKLKLESELLERIIKKNACSKRKPIAGFEIEAWLIDEQMLPAPRNREFLDNFQHPMAFPELAKFNIELNTSPLTLSGTVFSELQRQLQNTWEQASNQARQLHMELLMVGILPTLKQHQLSIANMSDMNRYQALNEQILESRGRPIHLDITGQEHLKLDHHDVMLESATTSFQIHIQLPLKIAHHYYNASIISSAPLVALCANAPYLFGRELWHETRIPLFEQAIETGGYDGAAHGPLKRVSFGSDYARESIMECFTENLDHFPILLPETSDADIHEMQHLRLHNGTIWRWNRPLIGFDPDGTPHIRVEQRTPAAGPTLIDAIANSAFYYGLAKNLCDDILENGIPLAFAQAKDNFYQSARNGLEGTITWFNGEKIRLQQLFQDELLNRARYGLKSFGISPQDIDQYLGIIEHRVQNKQNGSSWQKQFMHQHDDLNAMTSEYLKHQNSGLPVSEWPLN